MFHDKINKNYRDYTILGILDNIVMKKKGELYYLILKICLIRM